MLEPANAIACSKTLTQDRQTTYIVEEGGCHEVLSEGMKEWASHDVETYRRKIGMSYSDRSCCT